MMDQRQHPVTEAAPRRVSFPSAAAAIAIVLSLGLAGCGGSAPSRIASMAKPEIDPKLGVAPSPRVVAAGKPVPKGGGRQMVGKPYTIAGKRYVPTHDPNYERVGLASWYGDAFHGRKTANGELFDSNHLSAAHPTMPLPSYARVTNVATGSSVIVRVNDRGPFHSNRLIDVSRRTADVLGIRNAGIGKVKVEYVGPAPVHGDDSAFLMASYQGPGSLVPTGAPEIMLASATPAPTTTSRARTAPAVASGPAATVASIPAGALPPVRPVLADAAAIVVAFADPADAYLAGTPAVQLASAAPLTPGVLGTVPASGVIPAAYQQAVPATYQVPAPLSVQPARSSYAADRVDAAYAAVDDVGEGVSLSELAARLEALSSGAKRATAAPTASTMTATLQLGIFGSSENAARLGAALTGIGTVEVDDLTVNGKPMKRVRLSGLAVSVEDAVAAAERAGARGIQVIR